MNALSFRDVCEGDGTAVPREQFVPVAGASDLDVCSPVAMAVMFEKVHWA